VKAENGKKYVRGRTRRNMDERMFNPKRKGKTTRSKDKILETWVSSVGRASKKKKKREWNLTPFEAWYRKGRRWANLAFRKKKKKTHSGERE